MTVPLGSVWGARGSVGSEREPRTGVMLPCARMHQGVATDVSYGRAGAARESRWTTTTG